MTKIINPLIANLSNLHTTELGAKRIRNNLNLDLDDVVLFCRTKINCNKCQIYKRGKNWYCEIDNIRITINSYSYTIITANIISK